MGAYVGVTWTSGVEWYTRPGRLAADPTISMGVTVDGTMELPSIVVQLDNGDGYFSDKITGADADIVGAVVEVRWGSSTGTLLFTGYVTDTPETPANMFSISASMRAGGLEKLIGQSYSAAGGPPIGYDEFSEIRTANRQPNEGKWFGPWIGGFRDSVSDGGLGVGNIPCYRYGHVTATGERFIIGQGGGSKTKNQVYNAAGALVTSKATLTTHAPGSVTYDSLTYNSGNLRISANLSSTGDPTTVFSTDYGLGDIASLVTWELDAATLQAMGYENNNIAIGNWEKRTGIDFVHDVAKSFAHLPCIRETGVVYMRPITLNAPSLYTADRAIPSGLIDPGAFSQRIDYSGVIDQLGFNFWYHYAAAQFQRSAVATASSGFASAGSASIDQRFIASPQVAYKTALRWLYLSNAPRVWYKLTIPLANDSTLTSFWAGMVGSIVSFNEPFGYYAGTTRYAQVFRATLDLPANAVTLEVLDLSALCASFDNVRLLLRGSDLLHDSSDSTTCFDLSPAGQHEPTCTALTHGTDGAMVFNGTNSKIVVASSADFNPTGHTDWTIRMRVKINAAATQYYLFDAYYDAINRISLYKNTSDQLALVLAIGEVSTTYTSTATSSDTASYHDIVLTKVGNSIGVYFDGVQWIYRDISGKSDNNDKILNVGQRNSNTLRLNGSINLVRISADNCYGAAPVVGLTDDISANIPAWDADLWK